MAKKKEYYVVIHGRRPGLFGRWFGEEGAAEQVDGLADAVYKGFYTLQEAAEWLRELHAEAIPGLPPELVDLLGLHPEQPRREGPSALLKAGKILIYSDGGAIDNPGPAAMAWFCVTKGTGRNCPAAFARQPKTAWNSWLASKA
jgi:ribonuclease HI